MRGEFASNFPARSSTPDGTMSRTLVVKTLQELQTLTFEKFCQMSNKMSRDISPGSNWIEFPS